MPSTIKKKKTKQLQTNQKTWEWGSKQQDTFNILKEKLSSAPILKYPGYEKLFDIHADANGQGLGAVFHQEQ
jgi:hypothetical protein